MNIYEEMKPKYKKNLTDRMHFNMLLNYLLSRFEWSGLPENIHPEDLEGILIFNGTVGLSRNAEGVLWAFPGGYCGNVVGYRGDTYRGILVNAGEWEGKPGVDIAVGWNNSTRTPEFMLMQFSGILTEIDISEKVNVLFSRFIKIPKVKDSRERETLKTVIQNILNGTFDAFVSDNLFNGDIKRLLGDQGAASDFLELTDYHAIDHLQYLNQYHDNVYKRFWTIYGQTTQVSNKLAQMTDDEIHSNDNTNMVYILQCLKHREQLAEEVNRLFGTSISVKLSQAFDHELKEMEGGKDNETKDGEAVRDSEAASE